MSLDEALVYALEEDAELELVPPPSAQRSS